VPMSSAVDLAPPASRTTLAAVLCAGAAVAVVMGVYAKAHTPAGQPLFMLGFSGMLQMKVWLTCAATALLLVQLTTALWIWGGCRVRERHQAGSRPCTAGAEASRSS
jgi:Family of unknown function (DUF6529)